MLVLNRFATRQISALSFNEFSNIHELELMRMSLKHSRRISSALSMSAFVFLFFLFCESCVFQI